MTANLEHLINQLGLHLPHRSLPREGDRPEPDDPPLREHLLRASNEP